MSFAAAAQTLGGDAAELTKAQVLELETALAQLNFDPGKIDGVIDERTRAAIRLYQDFAALPADSEATPALLAEVLSVAQSFANMRPPRAVDREPDVSPDVALEKPAEPQVSRQEPEPPKIAVKKTPDEAPSAVPAETPAKAPPPADEPVAALAEAAITESTAEPPRDTPAAPAADSERGAEPETAQPQAAQVPHADAGAPAKLAEPPKKPKVETSIAEKSPPKPQPVLKEPPPKEPGPIAKKAAPAGGYNIGNVISRLAETGKKVEKPAGSGSAAAPGPVPRSGSRGSEQIARVPAPTQAPALTPAPSEAPPPARSPDKPVDGYAAFLDAYKAAQAGDFEYAAKRYTDAIGSKKLTLEHLGDAHFNRANALHFLGRYDKSIQDYGVAIGAKPAFAGAYYNRGFAYEAKGDKARAVDDFRRARDLGLQRLGVRAPDRMPPLR